MAGYGRTAFSGATSGIGQALGSLMMGDQAQQAGFDAQTTAQTKMGQALALIQQAQANARLHDAQAGKAAEEAAVLQRRPGIADEVMAASSGVDVPTLNAYRTTQRTGQAPQVPMGPADETGGMGMGAAKFGPESSSRMGQALARLLPILNNEKDINPEQYAKAAGEYRGQDLGDQVLAGTRKAGDVGRSQAAIAGKPMTAAHEYGVADLFGTDVDVSNPAAQRFGDYRVATTKAQKANAVQSYAAAGASNASAKKTRTEMNDGMGRGGKAPAGYRWAGDGTSLETIPGGPADPNTKGAKLAKPPTEGQAKALMFGARMAAANDVIGEMADAGTVRPGGIKLTAEGVAGAVPFIGDSLRTAAGAATNWTQSANQQLVEQAQADFINAILRRESGAVISDQEFARAQTQYFPEVGDSKERLRQKAANRQTAISGLKAEFGEAMLPEFDRIVSEARTTRKGGGKKTGGAGGSWGDGWSMEKVD